MAGADWKDLHGFFVLISDYLCNPYDVLSQSKGYLCAIPFHHHLQKLPGQYPVIPVFDDPLAASFSRGFRFCGVKGL
jgi:hypothetical protein